MIFLIVNKGATLSLILFYSLPLLSPKLLVFFLSNDYYMELLFFLSPCNLIAFFLFFLFFFFTFPPPLSLSHFSLLYNVADFYYWFSFFIFTKASLFLLIFLLCFTLYLNPSPLFFNRTKIQGGMEKKDRKGSREWGIFFFFYLILIFFFAFFFPFFCPLLLFSLPVWMTLN